MQGNSYCRLFEARLVPAQRGDASLFRVSCRYLIVNGEKGTQCLLGDAKSRRDHFA
jgi:hypothetical protein